MPSTEQQALSLIESLPDDSSFEEIMEEHFFSKKVQEGISDNGNAISHQQLFEEMAKEIIWSNRARADLQDIFDFIAKDSEI